MAELARSEISSLNQKLDLCEEDLMLELLPKDPDDDKNSRK